MKKTTGIESVTNNGLTWIDIQKPTCEKFDSIGKEYNFHELNIEDCLSEIQIPKLDKYDDHIFVIIHFPLRKTNKQESTSQTSHLSIFIGSNHLVTPHHRSSYFYHDTNNTGHTRTHVLLRNFSGRYISFLKCLKLLL